MDEEGFPSQDVHTSWAWAWAGVLAEEVNFVEFVETLGASFLLALFASLAWRGTSQVAFPAISGSLFILLSLSYI